MSHGKWHKDTVHKPISDRLEQAGCAVLDLSGLGNGAPDCACFLAGRFRVFEYKSDTEISHRKKANYQMRKSQLAWIDKHPRFRPHYRVVTTWQEAFIEMGLLNQGGV